MKKNFFLSDLLNKKYFHISTLYIIFFFVILILNNNIFTTNEFIKHHSTYNRDDIVFVYNSLLYSSGLEISHLDHPSLFTYFFFSSFYKVFNFFGFINFNDLEGFLNSENIELSLSKLFYISRLLIQIISLLIIFLFYEISKKYSKNGLISFFLTAIFIFSVGFVSASNRIESGLISLFFALLAFYFFIKFVENSKRKELTYFLLTFLFIFSAMMQKKIIFFLFPFLLFSSIFLIKKNKIEYFKYNFFNKDKFYKYILFTIYFIVLSFISYKTLINNTFFLPRDMDFIFLTSIYFMLNLSLFYFIKNFQDKNFTNLLTYNLIIGFTYISYKFVLIYFFSAPVAVWSISFTNFMGQLNMFANSQEILGAHNFNNLSLYIKKLFVNLIFVFNKYFFSYSFHAVLIWSVIILFFLNLKKTNKIEKLSVIIFTLGFITIQSILLFRYEQDTYYLNSEILLILALALNLKLIKNLKLLITIFSIIFILLFNSINSNLRLITKDNINSYCPNIDIGFYEYYTKKISKDIIKKLCTGYKTSK